MKTWGEELIEEGMAKGRAEGKEEGLAEGRAQALLRVLSVRRLSVDEKARQRILSCTDLNLLDQWLERALDAKALSEVLGELPQ